MGNPLVSPKYTWFPFKSIIGWALRGAKTAAVYGVEWDYSQSSTKLSRTNEAATFADPVPATDLTTVGTSPFDNVLPWSGMKRVQIGTDEMVYIPEFYFRVEDDQINQKMRWKITSEPKEGFSLHPGSGRYIARYHTSAGYASVSGAMPVGGLTRATFRTNSHAKGSNWWMLDIATWSAIQILYLVEYADWNCQTTLGGGQTSGSTIASGDTDSAMYHTISRSGKSNQYRWIENPYSNIRDWVDGNTMVNNRVFVSTDNSGFNDNDVTNYIDTGLTIALGGSGAYITGLSISEAAPWMFIPTKASGGSASTYIPDHVMSGSGYATRVVGGSESNSGPWGLFKYDSNDNAGFAASNLGARLIYIPGEKRMLLSSDNHTLTDVNGLYLIPKEDE